MAFIGSDQNTDSRTTTFQPDNRMAASDQGVVIRNQGSGNSRLVLRGGSVYNAGLSAEQVNGAIAAAIAAANQTAGVGTQSGDPSGFNLNDLLSARFALNNRAATDAVAASNPLTMNKYLLWGVGAILAIALFSVLKRK